ncbi:MAG: ABC transporter ATP-binding protein [Candidatus Diapherotrites archaeon]
MHKLAVSVEKKVYSGRPFVHALGESSFEVNSGEFISILGPSGCGKSTLLKIISGLDREFEGKIALNGIDVAGPSSGCGVVFQEARLLPWKTVRENIAFGLNSINSPDSISNVNELLESFSLLNFAESFPSQLSGGMSQKTALARALISGPEVILLDEPLASVDRITRAKLGQEILQELKKRKATALMVTHDIEEAVQLSDRILVMSPSPGKIVKEFRLEMPQPRKRTSKEFIKTVYGILKCMEG